MIWFKIYIIVITIIVDTYKSGSKFRLHQRTMVLSSCIEQNRCYQFIYHYFEYKPMGAHGLIFEGAYIRMVFFVNKSLGLYSRGLIIEGAYTRDFTVLNIQCLNFISLEIQYGYLDSI